MDCVIDGFGGQILVYFFNFGSSDGFFLPKFYVSGAYRQRKNQYKPAKNITK